MSLSYREKQVFFLQLGQLIRAGRALPLAAEKLTHTSSSSIRQVSRRLVRLLQSDRTAAEALDALRPELGSLERSTLSALARSGRLEVGLERLSDYFGTLATARAEVLRQSAYPLFILHLGVLLLNVQLILGPGGVGTYLLQTGKVFGLFYGGLLLLGFLVSVLVGLGARGATVDSLLRILPFVGKARRALSTSRFCGTLDLQLDAGVNVFDSMRTACEASQSGLILRVGKLAAPALRAGESIGNTLSRPRGALPGQVIDDVLLAEETGELHRTLPRLQTEYEKEGLRRLHTAAEWLPRLLYLGVMCYIGYRIVNFYIGYFGEVTGLIDSL